MAVDADAPARGLIDGQQSDHARRFEITHDAIAMTESRCDGHRAVIRGGSETRCAAQERRGDGTLCVDGRGDHESLRRQKCSHGGMDGAVDDAADAVRELTDAGAALHFQLAFVIGHRAYNPPSVPCVCIGENFSRRTVYI
jgi:hypothetical protein